MTSCGVQYDPPYYRSLNDIMDQRALLVVNIGSVLSDPHRDYSRKGIPLGNRALFLERRTSVTVRASINGDILTDHSARIDVRNKQVSLVSSLITKIVSTQSPPKYVLLFAEGGSSVARVIVVDTDGAIFSDFERSHPGLSLARYDLPPAATTALDAPQVLLSKMHQFLAERDQDLFAQRTDRFLRDPHILTQLLSHVMGLASESQNDYISHLRIVADTLREALDDGDRIHAIKRDHLHTWEKFIGQNITFADGGVSRIIGLRGADPMGIRVGTYTVVPGEDDVAKREKWRVYSYCIGDVLTDRSSFDTRDAIVDRKRAQEAARYILEPLSFLRLLGEGQRPDLAFLHGPLQNAFETYDEQRPNYTPGVDEKLLGDLGITESAVCHVMSDIPVDHRGRTMWNHCIPIYLYIMKRLDDLRFPIAGVVERSGGDSYTYALLGSLVDDGIMASSVRAKILSLVRTYDIGDEFLFGCVLKEGEYIAPVPFRKNLTNRAHDNWRTIVSLFPTVTATVLKTSHSAFPFRVEMGNSYTDGTANDTLELLYHTARLLPNYAFPVGLGIVDNYARVPDWLSRGVSATLASSVLSKAMQTGNGGMVQQLRQLLARSPRDFFFRPRS